MIPKRYENVKYEDVPKQIRELFKKRKETRKGIYLCGKSGTGKTHIIFSIIKKIDDDAKVAREKFENEKLNDSVSAKVEYPKFTRYDFYNSTDLLRKIKLEFDTKQSGETLEDVVESERLLILDDVGSEKMTEWVQETFYLILNSRYEKMLPVIITSNFTLAELATRLNDRIVSRIVEMCDVVELDGIDKRLMLASKIVVKV